MTSIMKATLLLLLFNISQSLDVTTSDNDFNTAPSSGGDQQQWPRPPAILNEFTDFTIEEVLDHLATRLISINVYFKNYDFRDEKLEQAIKEWSDKFPKYLPPLSKMKPTDEYPKKYLRSAEVFYWNMSHATSSQLTPDQTILTIAPIRGDLYWQMAKAIERKTIYGSPEAKRASSILEKAVQFKNKTEMRFTQWFDKHIIVKAEVEEIKMKMKAVKASIMSLPRYDELASAAKKLSASSAATSASSSHPLPLRLWKKYPCLIKSGATLAVLAIVAGAIGSLWPSGNASNLLEKTVVGVESIPVTTQMSSKMILYVGLFLFGGFSILCIIMLIIKKMAEAEEAAVSKKETVRTSKRAQPPTTEPKSRGGGEHRSSSKKRQQEEDP